MTKKQMISAVILALISAGCVSTGSAPDQPMMCESIYQQQIAKGYKLQEHTAYPSGTISILLQGPGGLLQLDLVSEEDVRNLAPQNIPWTGDCVDFLGLPRKYFILTN